MVVRHNLIAMNAQRQFGINMKSKAKSTEKLSSGYRVNRAADDAAGLAISEKMRWMIRGLNQGAENTQDGISFVQIGDGAMNEIHDMVHRMTELSIQAANGTLAEEDRQYIDLEVQQLKKEINRVANSTTFNEIPIFDNTSVIFGVEGTPKDLEIFNATYDSTGQIVTYGGFLFHGERITWDMISLDMVTTDATTGKQVFNGGDYSYTSAQTGYSFEFSCEDGDVPPMITREISISADTNGIVLGKERFSWDQVYDANGNTCSSSNLHIGPWAVDYYGSKFVFTVSDPVVDLEGFANDVNSCKNSAVYYNWEVYYSNGAGEKAVDAYDMKVDANRVTQAAVDNMLNTTDDGLLMTVRADDTGVWLQTKDGAEMAGSKKIWEDLGIQSWSEGMVVPGLNNGNPVTYEYKDLATGLSYDFKLSNITSKDSVIDGLDGMTISGTPRYVNYDSNIDIAANSNFSNVTNHYTGMRLEFEEEVDIGRNFDEQNWTTDATGFTYDNTTSPSTMKFTFNGGITMEGEALANGDIHTTVDSYLRWVTSSKQQELLNGQETSNVSFDDYYGNTKDSLYVGAFRSNGSVVFNIEYNYSDILKTLTDNIDVKLQNMGAVNSVSYGYIKNTDGTYSATSDYLQNLYNQIDADTSLTDDKRTEQKELARQDVIGLDKYIFEASYKKLDDTTVINAISDAAGRDEIIKQVQSEIWKEFAQDVTLSITSKDYSRVALNGNEKTNSASRPAYVAFMKETPVKPDIYIVHSSVEGDKTGIPRFAMNTTALGLSFADCKTVDSANQLMSSAKNALQYVSSKRATYGALQNRMEHTYNNNQNISENLTAAESRIRDTDMAKEMVKYSKDSILEQVGHAMMAQANQSKQGVLSLLN